MSAKGFMEKFSRALEETKRATGSSGLPPDDLFDLVREDPDGAAESIQIILARGESEPPFRRAMLQMAMAVAGAYAETERDDSLAQFVASKAAAWGVADVRPGIVPDTRPNAKPLRPDERLLVLQIDVDTWKSSSPYSAVRHLNGLGGYPDRRAWLLRACNKVSIIFDGLERDPRETWQVPEIRKYVANLVVDVPGICFFLAAEHNMNQMLFLALADTDAYVDGNVQLEHRSYITAVATGIAGMRDLCQQAGVDFVARTRTVLHGLPEAFQKIVLEGVQAVR
jgi:hypothetical protein